MGDGFLSLCWNNHRSTFCHVISNLRQKERYSDVTIACEGRFYPVHKLVLSVCSDYFDAMLERTPCKHPIIVLRDVQPEDLEALLSYMYEGIVSVAQNDLARLIKTAEMLRIKGLAVADEPLITTDTRRLSNVATSGIPIISNVIHTRPTRDGRISPQSKRRRREENGIGGISIGQAYTIHGASPTNDSDVASPNVQDHVEGRQRQRVEIHRDHLSKDMPPTEVVVTEALVKDDSIDEDDHMGKATATATLISTYGVVVSDGGTHHTIVSHPQDQVITHRYEPAQLQGTHHTHSQPLAEAVAEALAGPSGMQTWLGSNELGPASFTTVEAYTTEADVQSLQTQALESGQTTTVNLNNTSQVVNALGGPGTTVVVEASTVPPSGTGSSNTTSTGREANHLKCHYCNRATFRQTSDLKRHIRIHTGEKPFKCSFCPYKASRKDLLQAHSSKMHGSQDRQNEDVLGKFGTIKNE